MIDIKLIRENPDIVKENIRKKFQNSKVGLVGEVIDLDVKWRKQKRKLMTLGQRETESARRLTN